MKRISGGQLSREAKPRFYQVTPAVLGRRRTTQALPVRPKQSTQQSRVSPPPARGPTGRVGRHRPDAHHSDSDSSLPGIARTAASGVMQPSAIGAGDDCCDRGRSRSSRALLATGRASGGTRCSRWLPHWLRWSRSRRGRDRRRPGIWASVRRTAATDDRGLAASRLPDGRNGRSVGATLAAPVHRRSSASPRSYVNGIDARTLRRRRGPRRPPPSSRTDR